MEIFVVVRREDGIEFEYLCVFKDTNVDKNLAPVPLVNRTLEDNPIYSTPILVIAGLFSAIFVLRFSMRIFQESHIILCVCAWKHY